MASRTDSLTRMHRQQTMRRMVRAMTNRVAALRDRFLAHAVLKWRVFVWGSTTEEHALSMHQHGLRETSHLVAIWTHRQQARAFHTWVLVAHKHAARDDNRDHRLRAARKIARRMQHHALGRALRTWSQVLRDRQVAFEQRLQTMRGIVKLLSTAEARATHRAFSGWRQRATALTFRRTALLRGVVHRMIHSHMTARADFQRDAISVWRGRVRAHAQSELLWTQQSKTLKLMVTILTNAETRIQ